MIANMRQIEHITDSFLREVGTRKKRKELISAAKFVLLTESRMLKVSESPDFVISDLNGRKVGLEVSQIVTPHIKIKESRNALFQEVENKLKEEFPHYKGLFEFQVQRHFRYKSKDKSTLVASIVNYIHQRHIGENAVLPAFIDRVSIKRYRRCGVYYNEGAYAMHDLPEAVIANQIKSKDKKVNLYKENSETSIQWLLLVSSESGSESYNSFSFKGISNIESQFERIFLLRDDEVLELK